MGVSCHPVCAWKVEVFATAASGKGLPQMNGFFVFVGWAGENLHLTTHMRSRGLAMRMCPGRVATALSFWGVTG